MRLIESLKKKKFVLFNIFFTLYIGINLIGGERGLISYFDKKKIYEELEIRDKALASELKDLENAFRGRLSIQWVFSRANVEGSLFGRVETDVINGTLKLLEGTVDKFFLCGPEKMIETASKGLSKAKKTKLSEALDSGEIREEVEKILQSLED
mgnify:CR=1 FL=1